MVGTKSVEDHTLIIRVKQNTTYDARDGSISFYNNDAVIGVVTIHQEGAIRVQSITIEPSDVSLFVGQDVPLSCIIEPEDAYYERIDWKSNNPDIVSVTTDGIIRGVAMGDASISVSCSGVSTKCLCHVSGCANCYLISEPGTYIIPLVKGKTQQPLIGVSSAKVLWESYGTKKMPHPGDIISNVILQDGIIQYSTSANKSDGNALIAALDSNGNILWSWHIWVCYDYNPIISACKYSETSNIMMDRNIGALSATPGDIKSFGLYYEWGRKDPFLGPSELTGNYPETVKSTGEWPEPLVSTPAIGTVEYAISHPMTFLRSGYYDDGDWFYAYRATSFWGADIALYDPCPAGWRVPLNGQWDCWVDTSVDYMGFVVGNYKGSFPFDSNNYGMLFNDGFSEPSTWYPATGSFNTTNTYFSLGYVGYYWTASSGGSWGGAYAFTINNKNEIFSRCECTRSSGFPVRCVKE